MTHPDIENIERYGYVKRDAGRENPIGVCLFCGSDVYKDGEKHFKSFDGVFCGNECCHSYYEIDVIE